MKLTLLLAFVLALTGCTSFQFARSQGGGCLASTLVGAAAGGVGGAAIGAGSGQLAAIAGGISLGGTAGYVINPACHDGGYAPQPIVTK
jgi:hypothetical protein